MGFCCATSPVVAGAIRTRKWPLSRVFVGFNRQYVRSGHYGEVWDFFHGFVGHRFGEDVALSAAKTAPYRRLSQPSQDCVGDRAVRKRQGAPASSFASEAGRLPSIPIVVVVVVVVMMVMMMVMTTGIAGHYAHVTMMMMVMVTNPNIDVLRQLDVIGRVFGQTSVLSF